LACSNLAYADRARITQVIFNLLSNAVKFTKKELSQLNQEEQQQKEDIQQEVIVSVKNTGTGIYAENISKVIFKICDEI
jgi:signal transduction histidine kinase